MLDFRIETTANIRAEIGRRFRLLRLAASLPMGELGRRAGVSLGTVRNLEEHGNVTLENLLRICKALGVADSLQNLFVPDPKNLVEMERFAEAETRQRARTPRQTAARKRKDADEQA